MLARTVSRAYSNVIGAEIPAKKIWSGSSDGNHARTSAKMVFARQMTGVTNRVHNRLRVVGAK